MSKIKNIKNFGGKVKEKYIRLCKSIDNSFYKKDNLVMLNLLVLISIVWVSVCPILLDIPNYRGNAVFIIIEFIYGLFMTVALSCTILFHRKKAIYWVSITVLASRYLTLFNLNGEGNKQFSTILFTVILLYFLCLVAYDSAKNLNKNGGKFDTAILTVGLAFLLMGITISYSEDKYHKILIVVGYSLTYVYTVARIFVWIFFVKDRGNYNIAQTMVCIIMFVGLIFSVPFVLEYVEISSEIIREIIVPIYAAVVGGVLTLAGVAWTIKKSDTDKKETNRQLATPFFCVVDGVSKDTIIANNNLKQFIKPNTTDCDRKFVCNLINSDKNIFYIDKIQINGEDYISDSKLLIRKDEIFSVCIMDKKNICLQRQTIRIFITDINYEQRSFDIIYGENGEYNQIIEVN